MQEAPTSDNENLLVHPVLGAAGATEDVSDKQIPQGAFLMAPSRSQWVELVCLSPRPRYPFPLWALRVDWLPFPFAHLLVGVHKLSNLFSLLPIGDALFKVFQPLSLFVRFSCPLSFLNPLTFRERYVKPILFETVPCVNVEA